MVNTFPRARFLVHPPEVSARAVTLSNFEARGAALGAGSSFGFFDPPPVYWRLHILFCSLVLSSGVNNSAAVVWRRLARDDEAGAAAILLHWPPALQPSHRLARRWHYRNAFRVFVVSSRSHSGKKDSTLGEAWRIKSSACRAVTVAKKKNQIS